MFLFYFQKLVTFREELCAATGLELAEVELSMGMSTDYEHAVRNFSLSYFWLCFMSHRECKGYMATFQLYLWRKTSLFQTLAE